MNLTIDISAVPQNPRDKGKVLVACSTTEKKSQFEVSYDDFIKLITPNTPKPVERRYTAAEYSSTSALLESHTLSPTIQSSHTTNPVMNIDGVSRILDFLKDHGIDVFEFINESDRFFFIESNQDSILSLAWEQADTKLRELKTVRRVLPSKEDMAASQNNFLFLLSHGFEDGKRGGLHKIANDFNSEVQPVLTSLFGMNRQGKFKPQLFQVVKYLNEEIFNSVNLHGYNNLHLIMHGRENGDLGFEDPDDHWKIAWFSADEFVSRLNILSQGEIDLIFLSCCYAGYGSLSQKSLAFRLIDSRVCKYVIAYTGSIDSVVAAPKFVEHFYAKYMQWNDVVSAFHNALEEFKKLKECKNDWDKPVLYTRGIV